MENNEAEFNFKKFWGPEKLKPHVTFSRKGVHYCIYCGEESDTREHAPSRVFLNKPYPEDLPVLPACKICNNGFSEDELYTEIYIDSMKYLSGYIQFLSKENQERMYKSSAFLDAQSDLANYYNGSEMAPNAKVVRILNKLAVGHMVYELSEGYTSEETLQLESVTYRFSFDLTSEEKGQFDSIIFMSDKLLPSLGSRVFERINILELNLVAMEDENDKKNMPLIIMNWNDIQEANYKYIAWHENDDTFHIKMVIHEFLYAEVVFKYMK